jgi:hypothetical protein
MYGRVVGIRCALGLLLQRILRPQAVANVGLTALEDGACRNKLLVDATGLDDVVGDGVEDEEVGLRLEHHTDIGEVEGAVLEGRQHGNADMRRRQPAIGNAHPQDRMHLRHVGAPQHEGVGGFEVVVAARGLVDAERAHHAGDRGGHAVARIGIDVVRAQAGLEQV